ncbi:hypothetical protein ACQFN5_20190 [Klebsiella sp. WOUb02]|uniref:hypothetical protein n=1 Tax=Klebsiella sp. WOUb02 TaxID=3161071 RepID=UPI003CF2C0F4
MKEKGDVVTNIISGEVIDLFKEYAEIGVHILDRSGVVNNIPLVNTFFTLFKVSSSVRENFFREKLIRFLSELSNTPEKERIEMIKKLNEDDKFAGRTGEHILDIIEKLDFEKKPEIAAKLFIAFAEKRLSYNEFRHAIIALEKIAAFDIDKLKDFSDSNGKIKGLPQSVVLGFVNASLAFSPPADFGEPGYFPTELCKKFVTIL